MSELADIPVRHVTPVVSSDELGHQLDGFCWCQPLAEDQPLGGRIYIHRRTLDSPHIEVPVRVTREEWEANPEDALDRLMAALDPDGNLL